MLEIKGEKKDSHHANFGGGFKGYPYRRYHLSEWRSHDLPGCGAPPPGGRGAGTSCGCKKCGDSACGPDHPSAGK